MANTIHRKGNRLIIQTMSDPSLPANFLSVVHACRQRGYEDIVLDFSAVKGVFPNTAAPLAGLIQHYTEDGLDITFDNVSDYVAASSVLSPRTAEGAIDTPLNTVWQFNDSDAIGKLTNGFIDALAAFTVCEPGVLNALGFCVYEVLDNVLLHSELGYGGYAMAQIHPNAKHIALCIYDTGQGIFNSLRDSHAPKSSISAIETAIKKDVTSGKGAGFGLWGLHQIVDSNSGRLSIASGSGMLVVSRGTESKFNSFSFLSRERNCTLVDFQIDFDKRIDFGTALGGYEPLDFFIENVEDEDGNAVFSVKNECPGTGTRPDGVVARNRAMNYEKLAEARVLIDFAQVEHMSASFADEFIAKMVSDLGVDAFRERFSLLNRSSFVADLIDRATAKRVQPPNQAS